MDYTFRGILQARILEWVAYAFLLGIFPIQELNPGLSHCRRILYQLNHKGSQEYWNGYPILSPVDLPNPGIEPGSPALKADSLPTELSGEYGHIIPRGLFSLGIR